MIVRSSEFIYEHIKKQLFFVHVFGCIKKKMSISMSINKYILHTKGANNKSTSKQSISVYKYVYAYI